MIQGVFFFAYFGRETQAYHFSGMLHTNTVDSTKMSGFMRDEFGYSDLTDVEVTENTVSFVKKYLIGRDDTIKYTLRKSKRQLNVWIGKYDGIQTGKDKVKCIITEVPLDFLNS